MVPDILYPSAIDAADWGESQEENALPWDSINRANYTTFGDSQGALDVLSAKHNARVMQDPEFKYILQDIEEYKKEKDKKFISLVQSERIADKKEAEDLELSRTNERLKRMGKDPLKNLEDVPEAIGDLDPFLDEAANITYDMIGTGQYAINHN